MYTTVLRFEGTHSICLYFTGRRHAGENLDAVLALRDPSLPPIQWMSDGLAANTPKQHKDQTLNLNCLIHGRRQFTDIDAYFPTECTRVIDAIAEIYQHEAHCKTQRLTPAERLAYHQANSAPVMKELKDWMTQQIAERRVEPNSRLGGAFDYLLKRWASLTGFLTVPGAPLGRVEVWRGDRRPGLSGSAPFVWRCLTSRTLAPFPHPARRTRRADFLQRALFQTIKPSHSNGRRATAPGVSAPVFHTGTGRSIGGTPFPVCRAFASTRSADVAPHGYRYGDRPSPPVLD
jgi:transposase